MQQDFVSIFDLLNCKFIVVWTNEKDEFYKTGDSGLLPGSRYRYIATINDFEAGIKRIDFERNIISTTKPQTTGTCTNSG